MGKHLLLVGFLLIPAVAGQVMVDRAISTGGDQVVVMLTVESTAVGVIITEQLPDGWTLAASQPPPDRVAGQDVSWLLREKTGIGSRVIRYQLSPPDLVIGNPHVTGTWKAINDQGIQEGRSETPMGTGLILSGAVIRQDHLWGAGVLVAIAALWRWWQYRKKHFKFLG